ncbi:RNA-binding domain-containing protein [Dissoconium aciculare CBS 342.82]|uniref:RNA-binding domain-containing protein n=1 Tax=Dissoconium aciculare CBS 342.82 TaxID=1314786 RepID=A0A6J3LYR7_9PEZI|nr:RNA-binding domain-containing protein [Dissoconium aciculare CBS 342.82]KAF1820788.1 RNA-binding domain-containing protein [Dissoconium aciculare CBS 342.82]
MRWQQCSCYVCRLLHQESFTDARLRRKMFIGGLNWETTDQSLKDYFSQFGEVTECTVMRDGATGRSRGFGFLTFKDPKTVNTVMVKEHSLDGKLIDPKRAIPRDEQEKTAKIFVGGVSQEATEADFKNFFNQFGRVLDATLMMDKETGRPRGFGFVTFDSELAVERTLEGPLAILNKPIEVKRAQPRGKIGEEESANPRGFGRGAGRGAGGQQFGGNQGSTFNQNTQAAPPGGENNGAAMTPAMMAAYWQRMQQYFSMMSAANNMGGNMMGGMQNPMMQQMMAAQQQGGNMNPAMMQQMQQMANMPGYQGSMGDGGSPMPGGQGSPNDGQAGRGSGFNPQEQMNFERQKYERQQMARMQQQNFSNQNTWDGMYDDVPAPAGMQGPGSQAGGGRGGSFGGRGGRASVGPKQQQPGQQPPNAPANAPTGPKNAGRPGANYRGGGRGGARGYHPYARGGG